MGGVLQSTSLNSSSDHTYSNSSSSLPIREYEVFLSFRGPDTRDRITDILYRSLCRLKIHTFKDDEMLRQGEGIWHGLVRAINQAKIYVPIFSENYAHSTWCLKELAEIVRRSHESETDNRRPIILPVFYKVDPSDVRHQTGSYKEAFQRYENSEQSVVQKWKDALAEVGSLKGWHVKNENEQVKYADLVLDNIWSHLHRSYYAIETDKLVAIESHVEEVVKRLSLDSKYVTMVGLHGIGGIGKTTLAKAVYNKILSRFDRCSFIENIRETQQKDGILKIQKKLIEDAMRKEESIAEVSQGRRIIADRVSQFKMLIVLDDVDENFKFEEVVGNPRSFDSGSRFIITSRDKKVLRTLNEGKCELYDVQTLGHPHSLQLFSIHAFKKNSPPSDYDVLANEIVSIAGGLPLTLKVVGSLLHREEKLVWEAKVKQLRDIPERYVMERLKISYDVLEYEAKEIFLDIACLYIGERKERPFYMWNDCNFYPTININLLIQRSMLKIDNDCRFQMHDQLRDMGREIVRKENIQHPWRRSRIWADETVQKLLHEKKGTEQVKAIKMESVIELKSEYLENLSELRYLKASDLTGDFDNLLPNLRWLHLQWGGTDLINFHMKNMVILDLSDSAVDNDWGGWAHLKMANKLKVLDLHGCCILTKLPELPESGSLEVLITSSPVGNLSELVELKSLKLDCIDSGIGADPSNCRLPSSLTELECRDCFHLEWLPNLENLGRLSHLRFYRCPMPPEIQGLGGLKSLQHLEILYAKNLRHLDGLNLQSLAVLKLEGCEALERLPTCCSQQLRELQYLSIVGCPHLAEIQLLQLSYSNKLQEMYIEDCPSVTTLSFTVEESPLNKLLIRRCGSLLRIRRCASVVVQLPHLSNFPRLKELVLEDIRVQVNGLECLEELVRLKLDNLQPSLERIPSLSKLRKLQKLGIRFMPSLREIEGIADLKSLIKLDLRGCSSLVKLPALDQLFQLKRIYVRGCTNLTDQLSDLVNNLPAAKVKYDHVIV